MHDLQNANNNNNKKDLRCGFDLNINTIHRQPSGLLTGQVTTGLLLLLL